MPADTTRRVTDASFRCLVWLDAPAAAVHGRGICYPRYVAAVALGGRIASASDMYDPTEFADGPPASSLPDGPVGAVYDADAPAFDPWQDWEVVHQSDDRVDLVRELDELFGNGGGDVRTHESRTLGRVTGAATCPTAPADVGQARAPNGWSRMTTSSKLTSLCRTPFAGRYLGRPARSTCLSTSGSARRARALEGRIELVELNQTTEQFQLRVGVRPCAGGQDCAGQPAKTLHRRSRRTLGDSEIVNASVVPPRAVTVDGNQFRSGAHSYHHRGEHLLWRLMD